MARSKDEGGTPVERAKAYKQFTVIVTSWEGKGTAVSVYWEPGPYGAKNHAQSKLLRRSYDRDVRDIDDAVAATVEACRTLKRGYDAARPRDSA